MKVEGKVCSGPRRGGHLMGYLNHRIKGIVGFDPYPGTLDVKLKEPIDLSKMDSCKTLQHVNPGGAIVRECFFVPCKIEGQDAWAMQQAEDESRSVPEKSIIEIVSKKRRKDELDVDEGDLVKIQLSE